MIQVLDQKTINQIAAGEVIERPMAVVKELVENAIDAGATAVTIEIKEGGISFIRVTDNGSGIAKEEIQTAFLRHATSKIKSMEDLLSVHSLGFRGEALSSIAAVSQVELITRRPEDITGTRYEIAGGQEKAKEDVGCPEGTTFIMRNLFYNTPARRKFLKTKTTEGNYIQDLILRYCLAHAEIRFHFISDGKSKIQTSGDGQVKTNIFYNYGADVTKCIIPVQASENNMRLSGFIGKPELSRGNRTFMNYFVNGRYIKSPVITSAIEHAYKSFLMGHRYPFTALMLQIDSSFIDVNVHPTKMEVRFTNQEDVYNLFLHAIQDTLKQITLIPEVSLSSENTTKKDSPVIEKKAPEPFENTRQKKEEENQQRNIEYTKTERALSEASMLKERADWSKDSVTAEKKVDFSQTNLLKEELVSEDKPQFRIVGQVFDTYWLIEYQSELLIIDQHAAHEKVLYENLMAQLKEKDGLSQNLLAPIVITLSGREIEVLEENRTAFEKLGFRFEPFGNKDYIINGVPADFLNVASKELFLEMLDGMLGEGGRGAAEIVLERCASMACKAAVKGKQMMSYMEAEKLIGQMLQMDQPYHCPHGRPTTITMSKYEFDKKFKRII